MRAIKIDAEKQMMIEIDITGLKDWQREVCGYVQPIYLNAFPGHVLLIDEEGKVKANPLPFGFTVRGCLESLVGHGLLLKDARPNFKAATLSLDDVRGVVGWWGGNVSPATKIHLDLPPPKIFFPERK